jgi:hypothetical protein
MNERSPRGAAKSVCHGQRRRKARAQQQRALATRAAILNAAIAEFAERGFEGASIKAHFRSNRPTTSPDYLSLSDQGYSLACRGRTRVHAHP